MDQSSSHVFSVAHATDCNAPFQVAETKWLMSDLGDQPTEGVASQSPNDVTTDSPEYALSIIPDLQTLNLNPKCPSDYYVVA
jgi:hypothetical protein